MIPATISGWVVAPQEASEGATRFGLMPILAFFAGIRFSSSASVSRSFVISL